MKDIEGIARINPCPEWLAAPALMIARKQRLDGIFR
jgi:hypothetical protein